MDIDFTPLYDRTFIQAYKDTTELVDEIGLQLGQNEIPVRWNSLAKVNGHFFFIINPDNKKENISVGIWDALWDFSGSPLSISLDCERITNDDLKKILSDFFVSNKIQDCTIVEYEDLINIVFNQSYLQKLRYAREVVELILAIARQLSFNLNYNLSRW